MAGYRTERSDGRYTVIIKIGNPDGTKRRVSCYGRTQAEAKANAGTDGCQRCHVCGRSVEAELVALDVLHHEARLVDAIGRQ